MDPTDALIFGGSYALHEAIMDDAKAQALISKARAAGDDARVQALIEALERLQRERMDREDEREWLREERERDEQEVPVPINALDYTLANMPDSWDDYIGQEPLKRQILTYLAAAKAADEPFPHTLLKSGYPGVGKTTMARLIAKTMGVRIFELVPPFKIETLVAAAQQLEDKDVLFIDEIHKLTDGVGGRGAEILLKVLEDLVAYMPNGAVIPLNDITIIGATTEDKLPETISDRFKLKPYFGKYTEAELGCIALSFAHQHGCMQQINNEMAYAIGKACRGTPRVTEEMVMAAKALSLAHGTPPSISELLEFIEVEPDGLTRVHIHYLTAMYQYFAREAKDGGIEYIIGEAAIMQILRETKQGIGRIERFLVERGLIDRTPRGRRLTTRGIAKARHFIAQGKGAADVA